MIIVKKMNKNYYNKNLIKINITVFFLYINKTV